jgi:exonuclease VII small subunit
MKVKREIRLLEKEHDDNVQHAEEAAELGEQILNSYQSGKNLSQASQKKLDKLEKLVRKIRNQAGGSGGDENPEPWKGELESAVKGIADLSAKLRKEVEKTPRQVVSASIIEQANNLLELIQYIRKTIQ